jgi:hypothetical protein
MVLVLSVGLLLGVLGTAYAVEKDVSIDYLVLTTNRVKAGFYWTYTGTTAGAEITLYKYQLDGTPLGVVDSYTALNLEWKPWKSGGGVYFFDHDGCSYKYKLGIKLLKKDGDYIKDAEATSDFFQPPCPT